MLPLFLGLNKKYSSNNMTLVSSINDDNHGFPKFGLVQSLLISNDNKPFAICKLFITNYFDHHYEAFNVVLTRY